MQRRLTVTKKRRLLALTLAAAATVFAGVALATSGAGANAVIHARAAFVDAVDIKIKLDEGYQEVLHVPKARDTVMQQIVFDPRGYTGWHSHPGPAIALVKSGQFTLYSGDDPTCTGHTYVAGQAFVDAGQGHVHLGGNPSTTQTAEVWVTYLDVPPGTSPRIDRPAPGNCPF